jgi:protein phosphatase
MAVRGIARQLRVPPAPTDDQVGDRMRKAIQAANRAVFRRTLTEPDKRGMATTITALALSETRFLVGQVGDSRAYLLRGATLVPLTKDHSYVQELVDAGHLTPQQARTHPLRNAITRSIGGKADVVPDLYLGTVKPGDLYLLASDGLTGMLGDHELAVRLSRDRTPQDLVDDLIGEANRRGGVDNITAIVVRIESVCAPPGGSRLPRRVR